MLLVGQIMLHVSVSKLFLNAAITNGLLVLAIASPACNGKVVKETIWPTKPKACAIIYHFTEKVYQSWFSGQNIVLKLKKPGYSSHYC